MVAPNAIPVSNFVQVSVNLTPAAAQSQSLSDLLVMGSSTVIDTNERMRTYVSLANVLGDFGALAPEYLSAQEWFAQSPQPTQLKIGRWAKTASSARLTGALVSAVNQAIAGWNAIVAGAMTVAIDNAWLNLSGMSFAAAANLNGVAATIQTALRAAAVTYGVVGAQTATVVWNSTYQEFQVQDGATGPDSTIGFALLPTATGYVSFAGQPANNDTITLNGTVVTFKNVPVGALDVLIGASLQATLQSLTTILQASLDVQLVKFNYSLGVTPTVATRLFLKSVATGAAGNAYTLAKAGANIAVSAATLDDGVAVGNDISALMGIESTSSGAYIVNGIAAETALAAVGIFDDQFGQQWYGVMIPEAVDSDHTAVAGFIEGTNTKHLYFLTSQEGGILVSSSTTDIAYVLNALGYNRTFVQYSSSSLYAVASAAARLLSVDYDGNNTTITLAYKQEPGIVAEQISQSQLNNLRAKNANVFIAVNNDTAIFWPGIMIGNGDIWADIMTDLDDLAITMQTDLYNVLYTSTTKIPQTDAGMHTLKTVIESACVRSVNNGTLGPGTWNAGGFGTLKQFDFLPKGFYVYQPPIALQTQADRAARLSVPFQVAAKLAGAVHDVVVSINANQ